MDRKTLNALIVDDNDIDCRKDRSQVTLDDIKLANVGFVAKDLEKYEVIVYKGRLGKKVLKIKV